MKKFISGILIAAMLTSVLCACNNGENQSDTSQSENNANSSQQTVTTEAMAAQITTQPATEPNYENTNYVAPIPQKNQKYKFEEISLDEAATSSGYSMSDSKFRITDAYVLGEYLVVSITYSNINSTAFCAYNVIFDLEGNMVANLSNISLNEGYGKKGQIRGIYGDYTIIEFDTPIRSEEKFALYNLKTKELKHIDSEYSSLIIDNGVIIFGKNEENLYKYGALDLDLNEIIPAEYDWLSLASPALFRAKKDEKYGLIDFNNKVVADFNYKEIIRFDGIYDGGAIQDFERNINKQTLAVDEEGKVFLIDQKGKISDLKFELSGGNFQYGRIVSQYDGKVYIRNENVIFDTDGNVITDCLYFGNRGQGNYNRGFTNGYCVTEDNNKVYNLIDSKGNVIYSKSEDEYQISDFKSVDQNGLFAISYYSESNNDEVKTEFIDLRGNVVYTVQNDWIEQLGYGLFRQHKNKGKDTFYRITVE